MSGLLHEYLLGSPSESVFAQNTKKTHQWYEQ